MTNIEKHNEKFSAAVEQAYSEGKGVVICPSGDAIVYEKTTDLTRSVGLHDEAAEAFLFPQQERQKEPSETLFAEGVPVLEFNLLRRS